MRIIFFLLAFASIGCVNAQRREGPSCGDESLLNQIVGYWHNIPMDDDESAGRERFILLLIKKECWYVLVPYGYSSFRPRDDYYPITEEGTGGHFRIKGGEIELKRTVAWATPHRVLEFEEEEGIDRGEGMVELRIPDEETVAVWLAGEERELITTEYLKELEFDKGQLRLRYTPGKQTAGSDGEPYAVALTRFTQ